MLLKNLAQITAAVLPIVDLGAARSILTPRSEWQSWSSDGKVDDGNSAKAVYFQTNKASNSIVALHVAKDGTIASVGSLTPTGGSGGNLVSPMDHSPNGPDALASQDSVVVSDNLLFAVNAGSSTLSMFKIAEDDLTKLTMVGKPVWTGGDFPVAVAVSKKLGMACVGNNGFKQGVSCASYSASKGLGAFDKLRPINAGQTTPPTGPAGGIADVFFAEHDSTLVVTVKGNGTAANPGFVGLYSVDHKSVSYSTTTGSPAGAHFLFGATPIKGTSKILASNAGFGSFTIDLNNLQTPVAATNITNGKAPCWATISSVTGTGFISDVLVSQSVEVDLESGAIVSSVPCNNNGQGMIDIAAVKGRMYGLAPGNGSVPAAVTVFDLSGGRGAQKSMQNFIIEAADKNAQGMAVYY